MQTLLCQLVRDDAGQDLIECGLLAGFIALAAVVMIITRVNAVYAHGYSQVRAVASPSW